MGSYFISTVVRGLYLHTVAYKLCTPYSRHLLAYRTCYASIVTPLNATRLYGRRCCYVDHVKHGCNMFSPIKVVIDCMHEDNETLTYPFSPGADVAVVSCCFHRQRRMPTLAADM